MNKSVQPKMQQVKEIRQLNNEQLLREEVKRYDARRGEVAQEKDDTHEINFEDLLQSFQNKQLKNGFSRRKSILFEGIDKQLSAHER